MIDMAPQLPLTLPRCSDNEIAELAGWSGSLEVRHGVALPNFCRWLDERIADEITRRTSGGSMEAGTFAMPAMSPKEVGLLLIVLTSRSYCEQTEQIAKFFDAMLHHAIAMAATQLSEFETLCRAIDEQAEGER